MKCGIVTVRNVRVRLALKETGFENVPYDAQFLKAVNLFESTLIGKTAVIRKKIQLECSGKPARLLKDKGNEILVTLRYKGKNIPVTYRTIYQAYQQIIAPVLDAKLTEVRQKYLDPKGINPKDHVDKLKLALVGGFGQFELVRQQVYDFFGIHRDFEDGGREDAICYGAALIADGLVSLKKTAKLSMGLVTWIRGKKTFDFAITRRMDLEYDKVYYMPNPIIFGGNYTASDKPTWEFAIDKGDNENEAYCLVPRMPTQNELNKIEPERTYTFGFSVDDSDIYSIHVIPTDERGKVRYEKEGRKIRLGNFSDIFGPSVSYRETDAINKNTGADSAGSATDRS